MPPSIAELTELRALYLDSTQVSDISPLAALTQLTELWLNRTQVSDIVPLAALTRLTGLWLNITQVSDIAPIAALTRLTTLSLINTRVSDIAPLATLTRLTTLTLDNTQLHDLRPLRRLTRLVTDPELSGLTFTNCTAAQQDPEIARIAKIEDHKTRAQTLFDYLEDWEPPDTAKPSAPTAAPQSITLAANAVSVSQIRNQFRANRPEFSSRLEHLMVLVQQEQAVHRLIPIPNEEVAKAEYDAKAGFLEVMKAELIALRDELPEDHARPLSEKEARGLKERLVHLAQLTDRCITFLDKEQGTYGALYKIGLISAVSGLLSLVPGLNMIASTALAGAVFGAQTFRLHISKDKG
ncbi:leucine-rich repeat domain-containing protein [Ruegeria pomeroyi]|uniref:Leucine-rich repeat domain-containing protein n=1 Tax=Ruegeria pomeroyi TaxID=89184 RepID=A0A9Q3WLZ7_9RHOB|nr:leucine-rich repeat domain-containing protein [Ruegeria pomeroyi]MCE8538551.1 leucine-rich repeat domain-containing protein [Ruegeria pomeroyi]